MLDLANGLLHFAEPPQPGCGLLHFLETAASNFERLRAGRQFYSKKKFRDMAQYIYSVRLRSLSFQGQTTVKRETIIPYQGPNYVANSDGYLLIQESH